VLPDVLPANAMRGDVGRQVVLEVGVPPRRSFRELLMPERAEPSGDLVVVLLVGLAAHLLGIAGHVIPALLAQPVARLRPEGDVTLAPLAGAPPAGETTPARPTRRQQGVPVGRAPGGELEPPEVPQVGPASTHRVEEALDLALTSFHARGRTGQRQQQHPTHAAPVTRVGHLVAVISAVEALLAALCGRALGYQVLGIRPLRAGCGALRQVMRGRPQPPARRLTALQSDYT